MKMTMIRSTLCFLLLAIGLGGCSPHFWDCHIGKPVNSQYCK
jgi:hypothetical protein